MSRRALLVLVLISTSLISGGPMLDASSPACEPAAQPTRLPELPEASGITASRRSPGRLWSHNDSGRPELIAVDERGVITGRVRVDGATVEDWEAIAAGPCPGGSCIYIGDIGDNDGKRRRITIYRIAEPERPAGSVEVRDKFEARYPGKSQDAEALIVTPKGEILIVTKGETGPIAVFRVPAGAKPGSVVELEEIGKPPDAHKAEPDGRITDGAISPSGERIALRTARAILFFRTSDFSAGRWQELGRVSLEAVGESQGEGLTFADERTLYVVGEGGGESRPGTFARLTCTF
jgi:hypothetical protein